MPKLQHTDWPERLWVIRHGQSAGNVARDAAELGGATLIDLEHRDADTPLSELGERQAEALAQWFASLIENQRPTHFLSSAFVRAHQTCAAIATQLDVDVDVDVDNISVDERLREK